MVCVDVYYYHHILIMILLLLALHKKRSEMRPVEFRLNLQLMYS